MNNREVIIQIFVGGYEETSVMFSQIKEKLLPILQQVFVKKVIMGWARNSIIYEQTIQFLKPYGVECYLWLPVFSETGALKSVKKLVDANEKEIIGYQLKEGENFEFYCPSQRINSESFLKIYEENFSEIPFDGVFLDKIRFSSFANGITGVFNCFCPQCLKQFQNFGISVEALKKEMQKVIHREGVYESVPFGAVSYEKGRYHFENPIWETFFKMKETILMEALEPICLYFHEKKLKIGFDTFAPFMSYFVGQNMEKLAAISDFIKPMIYRITQAPAGLPFEMKALIEQCTGETENKSFYDLVKCERNQGYPFDKNFVFRELSDMCQLKTPIYVGIEINYIKETAEATPAYIRENAKLIEESGISGVVLSWDLLSAPEENVKEIIECFKHWR